LPLPSKVKSPFCAAELLPSGRLKVAMVPVMAALVAVL
jgi:hypothetical protein